MFKRLPRVDYSEQAGYIQTCTGWSSCFGPADPFKCIAGPIPGGCITAESWAWLGLASSVGTGISPTTESVSSVFTTPFILTTETFQNNAEVNQSGHIQTKLKRNCIV